MRKSPLSVSPVPTEQQPLNEYEQLKNSCFLSWATLTPFNYTRKLVWIWFWGWLVSGPIAAASFPPNKHPYKFTLSGANGSLLFVFLVVLWLYLSWVYVRNRLNSEIIFYEESGWYDGQNWRKPTEILNRDRLVVSYQIKPIVQRLKMTLGTITLIVVLSSFSWLLFLV
ncbi:MAG: CGLD27 family protein [Okeania sp. SIO2D1]|nr:CGLD27 family protein [Okeania sp. SIO2D1]